MKKTIVEIAGKVYNVRIAETEEEKEKGLQGITELPEDEGMLFEFDDDGEEVTFWMKDTLIPLDIVFIGPDGIVRAVRQGEPNSDEMFGQTETAWVLEVNVGSGIKEGDEVLIDDEDDSEVNEMFVLDSKGKPQMILEGNERIVSRIETKGLVLRAKKAYKSKLDKDYKALGKYMFEIIDGQNSRPSEFIDAP